MSIRPSLRKRAISVSELPDRPFSATRVAIWAVGGTVFFDVIACFVLAYQNKQIPPMMGDVAKVGLGALAGVISARLA